MMMAMKWPHFDGGQCTSSNTTDVAVRCGFGCNLGVLFNLKPIPGFDHLMPEGRSFPYNYIPRLGASLRISIGSPLSPKDFSAVILSRLRRNHRDLSRRDLGGWLSERRIRELIRKDGDIELELQSIRSEVT